MLTLLFFGGEHSIKMCTTITQEDFVTVHHEMGHIQYFMNYRNQHWVFRNGANPGKFIFLKNSKIIV